MNTDLCATSSSVPAVGDPFAALPDQGRRRGGIWSQGLSLALLAACVGVLVLASGLDPELGRVGTHQQLGLPACGFLISTKLPCVTCGMTTAFALAADGRLLTALRAQPAGAILAILMAVMALIFAYTTVAQAPLMPLWKYVWRPRVVVLAGTFFVVSWLYKIAVHSGAL